MKGLTNAYNHIGRAMEVVENFIPSLFDLIIMFLKERLTISLLKKRTL